MSLLVAAVLSALFLPSYATSDRWAVIAVGSKGYTNYRHQADGCHAYQILRKSGVPAEQIIVMMQDDVANSGENPFKGKLYNKLGTDVPDVYDGCKIDYRGDIVTAELFLSVLTGDESGVPNGGKVLKSGPNDKVFLNFVDHGGVGIIAMPNGPLLHASELSQALKSMQERKMFKELLFYMEACESGSMFPDLTSDGKIFAVTAANGKESSWGYYCSGEVNGKSLNTCLGDLFSISWMEDSDLGKLSTETIKTQVQRVTKRTTKSHVSTFGDKSFESEPIGNFEFGLSGTVAASVSASPDGSAVDVRDIPLQTAYSRWNAAETKAEKAAAWMVLQAVVKGRAGDEKLFDSITRRVCEGRGFGCTYNLKESRHQMQDAACHKKLVSIVHESCPRRARHNTGGWNGFNMKFSQTLVNLCERRERLAKDVSALEGIVHSECQVASAAVAEEAAITV